jgi:hypothetical protein
MVSERAAARAQ